MLFSQKPKKRISSNMLDFFVGITGDTVIDLSVNTLAARIVKNQHEKVQTWYVTNAYLLSSS